MIGQCAVCKKPLAINCDTPYDDFYGDLCNKCWVEKVQKATHNPWTGRPL